MKQKFIKKFLIWTGIISISLMTIGLPLFFIGGAGQKVLKTNIITKEYLYKVNDLEYEMFFNPTSQPASFFDDNNNPVPEHILSADGEIQTRINRIDGHYQKIVNNVASSGFFDIRSLSDETNLAITAIGDELIWIRDNTKLPITDSSGQNENYNLSPSLFDIQQQLNLIVRINPLGNSINNVLSKNIEDNTALATSGIIFSVIGTIGLVTAGIGYFVFLKNKVEK